jgi:hypothetical protein
MLLLGIIERMDRIMKNESDLKAALQNLSDAVAALKASVDLIKIPAPADLTEDVAKVDAVATTVNAMVEQVNNLIPPPATEPPPAS